MSYTVQYWNERDAQWKRTGSPTYATRELAREHQFDLIRQTNSGGAGIRFRVLEVLL